MASLPEPALQGKAPVEVVRVTVPLGMEDLVLSLTDEAVTVTTGSTGAVVGAT